ncbi:phosphopantetheine-binding protein [Chitinophaga caseinilytica]|uniref:phosphopantetheine-binding protein n=1 Tax=Chitinophaga caseinilytica TaxID=2267521 RepID=UPI003C2FA62B
MELNKFIQDFASHIEDLAQELSHDTEFKALNVWDSMNALAIIAMIDRNYNKQITGDQLEEVKTIEDLFNLVRNN